MDADRTDSHHQRARAPAGAGWALSALALSLLVAFIGLISNMGSAPGNARAFLVEKLGLLGGAALLCFSLAALAFPALRRPAALAALAAFAGLLLLSSGRV